MKRTAFDERRDQAIADEATRGMGPCLACKASTAWETLSQYGARCQRCYDGFCSAAQPFTAPRARKREGQPA